MMEGSRISPPTEESIARFQGRYYLEVGQEGTEFWIGRDHAVPLTFPNDDERMTSTLEGHLLGCSGFP